MIERVVVIPNFDTKFTLVFDLIISNPANSHLLAKNGRKAVKSSFNWENEANNLLDMYHDLAKD